MTIAVIGAGAIGSVVAAYLSKAGEDVVLVAKLEQADAINKNGLAISGARGEERFTIKTVTKLGQNYDLVIFATKTQDLEAAYHQNSDFLETAKVLTTQNGVQADNLLSCHFEKEHMFSSIVMFGATYIEPGKVVFNFEGDWIIGRPFIPVDPATHDMAGILKKAFPVSVSNNIMGMKYLKLFVNFNNCIPAVVGKSMQETFADKDLCRLSIQLLKEGLDTLKKVDIQLVSLPNFPVERIQGLANMPIEQAVNIISKTLTSLSKEPLFGSILQSILRRKTSEIDFINGEVVHLAHQIREKAPLNEAIVDMVHTVERTGKFYSVDEVKQKFQLGLKEAKHE